VGLILKRDIALGESKINRHMLRGCSSELLQYTPMYTKWTEALLGTEPGKQKRALLQTTGKTPKRLSDCKTYLLATLPLG
jgi:hypothetical protein